MEEKSSFFSLYPLELLYFTDVIYAVFEASYSVSMTSNFVGVGGDNDFIILIKFIHVYYFLKSQKKSNTETYQKAKN